jgi:hypothetical protein
MGFPEDYKNPQDTSAFHRRSWYSFLWIQIKIKSILHSSTDTSRFAITSTSPYVHTLVVVVHFKDLQKSKWRLSRCFSWLSLPWVLLQKLACASMCVDCTRPLILLTWTPFSTPGAGQVDVLTTQFCCSGIRGHRFNGDRSNCLNISDNLSNFAQCCFSRNLVSDCSCPRGCSRPDLFNFKVRPRKAEDITCAKLFRSKRTNRLKNRSLFPANLLHKLLERQWRKLREETCRCKIGRSSSEVAFWHELGR